MRCWIQVSLITLTLQSPAAAVELRWPDPGIAIPPLVHQFILSECRDHRHTSAESIAACIFGERQGYRAVVMMLTDETTGEMAAARYRECGNDVVDPGGAFHRTRATCIGRSFNYRWQFEFIDEAVLRMPKRQA